jgi:hypothetical protein
MFIIIGSPVTLKTKNNDPSKIEEKDTDLCGNYCIACIGTRTFSKLYQALNHSCKASWGQLSIVETQHRRACRRCGEMGAFSAETRQKARDVGRAVTKQGHYGLINK